MRVVTLITRLIRGGAQRIALETAAYLASLGHDAPLWCGPESGPEGSLHEEAAARGVHVRIFPHLRRAVAPWHDLAVTADLSRALRDEPPDILHTHSSKAGIVGREAAARAGTPRVVHTVHGWGFTPETAAPMRALFVALERREARRAELVFVHPGDREEGRRLGIVGAAAGAVIPPGIDLEPYTPKEGANAARRRVRLELELPDDAVVGGFLGRLSAQKDPGMLLAIARVACARHPSLYWLIAGDGPLAPALRAEAAGDAILRDRLRWAGLVSSAWPWLAAMDFYFLPSRWEGAPLSVMEAMAAGLPVVATDLPGVRWILAGAPPERTAARRIDGGSAESRLESPSAGVLVPSGDSAGFLAAVEGLTSDLAHRRAAADAARALAFARFGRARMLDELLALYERRRL